MLSEMLGKLRRRWPELLLVCSIFALMNTFAKEMPNVSLVVLVANIAGISLASGIRYIFEVLD